MAYVRATDDALETVCCNPLLMARMSERKLFLAIAFPRIADFASNLDRLAHI